MSLIKSTLCSLISLCCLLFVNIGQAAQETSVLKIDSGPIQGIDDGELLSWEGIPYAAPPVGKLRWQPPQGVAPWKETRKTIQPGSACTQNADLGAFATPGGSEDCLFLNVYAPRRAFQANKSLPVFIWIHGGSLWVGQGSDYNPRKLALEGNTIVVTINYRLGMFGFFAHPTLDKEGHAFANYGLMDQVFAMEWVQKNIRTFGGDPNKVTVAGESSGGNAVLDLVASPWAAGKFQAGVSMSGSAVILRHPNFGAPRPLNVAEKTGAEFAKAAGCLNQSAQCLRQLTTGQILSIQRPYLINQVIIDGDFMPMHPGDAFKQGKINKVTLINGTTRDEGRFFVGFPENETGVVLDKTGYSSALKGFFGETVGNKVEKEYQVSQFPTASEAFAATVTDYLFACPARKVDDWASKITRVHGYEFADRTAPSYLNPTTFPLGAAHTYEIPYIFEGFHGGKLGQSVKLNPIQESLSREMIGYWSNATNASNWKNWPQYHEAEQRLISFKPKNTDLESAQQFRDEHHCNFWDNAGVY